MNSNSLFVRVVLVSIVLTPACAEQKDISPKISFEQTVCGLGQVGLGSRNTCEFKFTNAGRDTLKITNIRSTCGCAVARLERQEYAPGEPGTLKVTYTAHLTLIFPKPFFHASMRYDVRIFCRGYFMPSSEYEHEISEDEPGVDFQVDCCWIFS